jgi:translocation and assembly module TamB
VGGYGEFDGVMLKTFAKPRIEGTFTGDHLRAWDVDWGKASAKFAIENSYAFVSESTLKSGDAEINATGTFSLGYPRKDGGEQLNARVRLNRWPLLDLRHAFELDDWPVEGQVSGDYHVYGNYETPFGFGNLVIDQGIAYGETFDKATASLGFEGNGVRITKFQIGKSTGQMTGAAWIGWDGNYSFNADGRRIPVESLKLVEFPKAPLSGLLQFSAEGTGTFENPRYDVKLRADDLFAGDEGIGTLTGTLGLRGELVTISFDAASSRLAVSGVGRVGLTDQMDAEMTLRFTETSLDPYLRFFEPRLSPFTNAVAGGTVRVSGELSNIDQLVVEANVEQVDLKLFDYQLRNNGPILLALDRNVAKVQQLKLQGEGTALEVTGDVNLHNRTIDVSASGDANVGILQGFFRDIRSSGSATLRASVTGSLSKPEFSGSAGMKDARIRYLPLPHGLENINGTLAFDAGGIRVNDVRARVGRGDVIFGGRITMNGFVPGDLNLTATGERMNIRYIDGFPAVVDADLALRGTLAAPVLSGTVTVRDAQWTRRFEATPDIISLATGEKGPIGAAAAASAVPLRLDIHVLAPGTLRIENNLARVRASADLRLGGTYDRPQLFGRADILRGDLLFEGNRYVVTRGSVDFSNPVRIDPYVDLEAETRVRVPGGSTGGSTQTYRVTIGVTGTATQFTPTVNSDPPLPEIDIVSLLLGQQTSVDADLRLRNPATASQAETELLRGMTARLLASPIVSPVGRAVEQTLGFDTVQITPSIGTESDPLNPSARLILGKRVSNRAYVTFARALGSSTVRDQIITVEYDQNDRVGFVITQTGNNTFAIDFRVRHIF